MSKKINSSEPFILLVVGVILAIFSFIIIFFGNLVLANLLFIVSVLFTAYSFKKFSSLSGIRNNLEKNYAFIQKRIGIAGKAIIIFFILCFVIGFLKYGVLESNIESFSIFGNISHIIYVISGINTLALFGGIILLVIFQLKLFLFFKNKIN